MLLATCVAVALLLALHSSSRQQLITGAIRAEHRVLAQLEAHQGMVALKAAVHQPVSQVLAVIPTCKRDLDIARASRLWRRDSVHALFLLAEQDRLAPEQELALLAENVTVG